MNDWVKYVANYRKVNVEEQHFSKIRQYIILKIICKIEKDFISDKHLKARGFNGSVNISESCDFRSQFDPLSIIF